MRSTASIDEDLDQAPIDRARLTSTGRGRWRAGAGLAVAFVALALLKPWGPGAPLAPPPSPVAAAAPTARVGPVESSGGTTAASAVHSSLCPEEPAWLVVTDDELLGSPTRTWAVVTAIPSADGPGDARIPVTQIVTAHPRRIGFCAPDGSATWRGMLWKLDAPGVETWRETAQFTAEAESMATPVPVPVREPIAASPRPSSSGSSPAATSAAALGWPPGRYVFHATFGSGPGAWIGFEIAPEN